MTPRSLERGSVRQAAAPFHSVEDEVEHELVLLLMVVHGVGDDRDDVAEAEAAEAIRHLETGHPGGKIVIDVS